MNRLYKHDYVEYPNNTLLLGIYLLFAIVISFPLIIHLNGVLLPGYFPDISHSDIVQHTQKTALLSNTPIIVDDDDVSHTYLYLAFFLETIGTSSFASFNIYFILTLTLAGFFTNLYITKITANRVAGFVAGFVYMSTNYIFYAYFWGHSNTVAIQWLPLIFYFTEKLMTEYHWRDATYLGLVLCLQVISTTYMTIFTSFYLPLYILLRNPKYTKRFFLGFLLAGSIALLLASPYLVARVGHLALPRTLQDNNQDYWRLSDAQLILAPSAALHPGLAIFIGLLFSIPLWKIKAYRKKYLAFAGLSIFVLLAMIGPVSVFLPYYWLFKLWPFFSYLRVPFRQFPFFVLPLLVIGASTIPKVLSKKQWLFLVAIMVIQITLTTYLGHYHIFYPTPQDILTAPMN